MKLLTPILLAAALLAAALGGTEPTPAPAPKGAPVYVASAKSQVFHRPDCPWARKIDPKNLQTFKTREDALKAGKRPCKVCQP